MKPLLEKVKSSNLDSIGHEEDILYIRFIDGGLYSYQPFTASTFKKFQKAPSKGKFFHKYIRNNKDYKVTKIE